MYNRSNASIALSCLVIGIFGASSAFAGSTADMRVTQLIGGSEADQAALGYFEDLTVAAEGRIGSNSVGGFTYELDYHRSNFSILAQDEFIWPNGAAVDFVYSYDPDAAAGQQLTFTVNDPIGLSRTLAIDPANPVDFASNGSVDMDANAMWIRASASKDGSSIALTHLTLNGTSLGYDAIGDKDSGDRLTNLIVEGVDFSEGFTVTGLATLGWDPNNMPKQSHINFNLKLGNTSFEPLDDPNPVVPAPAAVLLGLSLISGLTMRRHRR